MFNGGGRRRGFGKLKGRPTPPPSAKLCPTGGKEGWFREGKAGASPARPGVSPPPWGRRKNAGPPASRDIMHARRRGALRFAFFEKKPRKVEKIPAIFRERI